ncbi:MFS transporter [Leifsonella bigeumensis]|uniref:MFS transporter n=1 Tax=Leifsonella bigeumensis TaxID=433643 RepID=UPI0031E40848
MTPEQSVDEAATAPIPVLLQRPRWRDTFSSLRIHNYRLYVISQAISNTSGWAMRIAIDWLVFELTGSVTLVGITVALQFGPMLFLGPLGGVIADRYPKRRLLVTTQAVNAAACATLAVLTIAGVVTVWEVFATALIMGCTAVVDSPARSVFVNEMVGHDRLGNAISINASIFHLGGLVGPAVSGILIAIVGAGWSIAANALAACVVVVTLLSMRSSELLPSLVAKRSKGQIREGLRYALSKPTIFWPTVMLAFVATFGMNLPVMLVAFADHVFGSGAAGYGLYSSAAALGALAGSIASTRRMGYRLRSIMLAAGCFGLTIAASGIAPVVSVFLLCLAGIGFTRLLFATAAESIVQMSSNRIIRGRVMAIYAMVVLGGQAIGGPLMGWLAELWGVRAAMVFSGLVPTLAAIVIALLLARSGRLTLRLRMRRRIIPLTVEVRGQLG